MLFQRRKAVARSGLADRCSYLRGQFWIRNPPVAFPYFRSGLVLGPRRTKTIFGRLVLDHGWLGRCVMRRVVGVGTQVELLEEVSLAWGCSLLRLERGASTRGQEEKHWIVRTTDTGGG